MNKQQEKFWIIKFVECIKKISDTSIAKRPLSKDCEIWCEFRITEHTTKCDVYIFAPNLVGEQWEIIMICPEGGDVSDKLRTEIEDFGKKLQATVTRYTAA